MHAKWSSEKSSKSLRCGLTQHGRSLGLDTSTATWAEPVFQPSPAGLLICDAIVSVLTDYPCWLPSKAGLIVLRLIPLAGLVGDGLYPEPKPNVLEFMQFPN